MSLNSFCLSNKSSIYYHRGQRVNIYSWKLEPEYFPPENDLKQLNVDSKVVIILLDTKMQLNSYSKGRFN